MKKQITNQSIAETDNYPSLQDGDGGGNAPRCRTNKHSIFLKNGMFTGFLLLLAVLFLPAAARATITDATLSAAWNANERRIDIRQTIASYNGSDKFYHGFRLYVDGTEVLKGTEPADAHSGNNYQKITLTSSGTTKGTVVVGYLTAKNSSNKGWVINPINSTRTFYVGSNNYVDMWVEYYPNDNMLGKTVTIRTECYEGNINTFDPKTQSVDVTNPLSSIQLDNLVYGNNLKLEFDVKRTSYHATHDKDTKVYYEYFTAGETNTDPYFTELAENYTNSGSYHGRTKGAIGKDELASGLQVRLKYEKDYDDGQGKQKTKYTRYSNKVTLQPIKLPKNPTVTDIGCGKLKIAWSTETGTQSSQAGDVKIKTDNNTYTVAYSAGSYEYTIPPADIGTGNKTYSFTLTRAPFNFGILDGYSKAIDQTVAITKNMAYRQLSNFILSPQGDRVFNLTWNTDGGYYCSDYKYRITVLQGTGASQVSSVSPLIDIDLKNVDVNVSNANFNFCEKSTILINMVNNLGLPLTLQLVTADYVFIQSGNNSQITQFSVSKGFYAQRVQLDWKVSASNQFNRYLVYRKVYGSAQSGNGTLISTINHSNGVTDYNIEDVNAVPGTFYNYTVEGQMDCGSNQISTIASAADVGYILPFGTVSGRVSYTGSQAVRDVTVMAQGNGEARNKVLEFNESSGHTSITTPYKAGALSNSAFTFQAWVNLQGEFPERRYIMCATGKYAISILGSQITFNTYRNSTTSNYAYNFNVPVQKDIFTHISITYECSGTTTVEGTGTATLYINGEPKQTLQRATLLYDFSTSNDAKYTYFGRYWNDTHTVNGYMDELRLWNRALSATEIAQNYNAYITGKEDGLKLYYRFDELDALGQVFDVSANDNVFNENHGVIYGTVQRRSDESAVPTAEQLSIKAVTDANGNYLINTIPYTGDGSTYSIIPSFPDHNFNPTSKPLFFNNSSSTHNNVDFTDISSFMVRGKVEYEGGSYPVADCSFEVDGQILTMSNGTVVKSENNGNFAISVPIGVHSVRVVKQGHTFANGGYLKDADSLNLNYNAPLADIRFKDQTKVKFIGRVVGGNTEDGKPLGFGESVNNIGVDSIVLNTTRREYDFVDASSNESFKHATYSHNNGQWRKPGSLTDDSTRVDYNQKNITIHVSPQTGEFSAMVYPEPYNIQPISVTQGYGKSVLIVKENAENIDLTATAVPDASYLQAEIRTWADSTFVTNRPGVVDHWEYSEQSDTVRYNSKWTFKYQATPTFGVKQIDNGQAVDYFGEKTFELKDEIQGINENIALFNENDSTYMFGKPVFQQGNKYDLRFNAYEEYTNYVSNPAVTVTYPVSNGTVNLTNNLQVTPQPESLEMDSAGILNYAFMAGAPNLTTASGDIFATLALGAVSYYWNMGTTPLVAWQIGEDGKGNNFMTSGPDQLTAILRDPPGSGSYAYFESGKTITSTSKLSAGATLTEELNLTTSLGANITTFVGLGAGVITEVGTKADLATNISSEQTYSYENECSITTTFNERFQTSSSTDFVGAPGDVFIGNSTNIIYGLTKGFRIFKGATQGAVMADSGEYKIASSNSIAYGPDISTRFAFTAMELEDIMIPKWKNSIALRLMPAGTPVSSDIQSPVYVSNLPTTDPNYGKWNLDEAFKGQQGFSRTSSYDGLSYTIHFPSSWKPDSEQMTSFVDSILWANNQIGMWEAVLAQNEKEKVEMQHKGNYSFGGGATIEYSEATASNSSYTHTWGFNITPTIGLTTGVDINGVGIEIEVKGSLKAETGGSTGSSTGINKTTGFVLAEEGTVDEITVDYGYTESGTFAFKTRGGQTSCPYEGEVLSKYYQPGQHILQEATMQIEVPVIEVSSAAQVLNVPANRTAIFTLALQNESQTNNDVWFMVAVDEATNPNGAELKIDGIGIGNGRTFLVRAGEVLTKTLAISKGTVDDYDNIGIILKSLCEPETVADTAWVTAHFVPACSDVAISAPANNFIVNTASPSENGVVKLSVTLQNFDVNFPNFGYICLEYRAAGTPVWTTARTFYPDHLFNSPTNIDGTRENIRLNGVDRAAITYEWPMPTADGQYELRATTASVNIVSNAIGTLLSTYSTNAIVGYKDMTKPQALGAPSPANGIYGAGDELSVTFNEDIQTSMVISNNITVTYDNNIPVPITFVTSANKITMEYPGDYFPILEGKTLNIKVKDIYDMRGNRSDTIAWTALVNRNALVWETDLVNLTKEAGNSLTFTAKIKNAGNQTVSYSIVNLPQWLSVNQPTGTLQPLSTRELTFTISSGVNLGSYTEQIGVTSGNSITKNLPLQLTVTGILPEGWAFNPADYESTMTVTGRIQIGGVYQTDTTDILAAFIGDECVGLTSPIRPSNNGYYTFLTVHGNAAHAGQAIKFKVWDASTGNVYSVIESKINDVMQNFTFTANAIKGDAGVPVIHNALNMVEQSIALQNGWNWISANVLNTNPTIIQQFKDRVGTAGEMLKGQTGYIQNPSWTGTLTGVEKEQMYLVKTNAATTLHFDGTPAVAASSPITLANGWNWIGYIPQFTLPVNEALANLAAQTNDQIKGHNAYRVYASVSAGWVGNLNYMRAGEGYMYNSGAAAGKTFNYPSTSSQVYHAPMRASSAMTENRWQVDIHKYSSTMTMTSVVVANSVELQSEQIEVAAFDSNGECRGSAVLQNVPQNSEHPYLGFLMVFGESSENLTLKVYDHATGTEYTASNVVSFATDAIHGNPAEPYRIQFVPTGIDEISIEQVVIYPNPVADVLNIASGSLRIKNVKIMDALGKIIRIDDVLKSNTINVSNLTSGLYAIQITTDNGVVTKMFVKK